ncbi:alanine racemase [Corynebacterium frankenforstense]
MTAPPPEVREAVAGRPAPFSVLDLDAALANARDMARRARGTPIRLATKSLRIRELISRVLEVPGFSGLLSFHLGEALWLVDEGVSDDILVAYPCADPDLLAAWSGDPAYRRAVTVMVDCPGHLRLIEKAVEAAGLDTSVSDPDWSERDTDPAELRVCLDVDASYVVGPVHIGARRSPVHSPAEAEAMASEICSRPGMRLVGLMAYEGQIAGTTDTSPAIAAMKRLSVDELAGRRAKVVDAVAERLAADGLELEFVNGGGTGSIETTRAEEAVTEIGAGSGVLGPGLFDHYKTFQPHPAEWFVVPVVRHPARGFVTVAGGGRVASGAPGDDRLPVVDYPEGLRTIALEGAGEVQTPLRGAGADRLRLGDHVWMRHAKAGEQAEWTDSVLVVSDGLTVAEWPTYRGEQRSFV